MVPIPVQLVGVVIFVYAVVLPLVLYPKVYEVACVQFCPVVPEVGQGVGPGPVMLSQEKLMLPVVMLEGLFKMGALRVVVTAATGFLDGRVPVNDSIL